MAQDYPRRRPAFLDQLTAPDFKATAAQGCFVYAYIRAEDGSPYYVGIASKAYRPLDRGHNCPVPPDCRRIRILRAGLSKSAAAQWEQTYIARWGRKDKGTGILRNMTDGGDGTWGGPGRRGVPHDDESKQKIAAWWSDPVRRASACEQRRASWDEKKRAKRVADSSAMHAQTVAENAALVGLAVEAYLALGATRRHELVQRAKGNMRQLLTPEEKAHIISAAKLKAAAQKLAAGLGLTEEEYIAMSPQERQNLSRRVARGPRPGVNPKVKAAATAYGVDIEWYAGLTAKEKAAFRERVARANKKAADCSAA
jgi:hypothetical protein